MGACCSSGNGTTVVNPGTQPKVQQQAASAAPPVLLEEPSCKVEVPPAEHVVGGELSEDLWRVRVAKPQATGEPVRVKALTYNLFWRTLYGERQGNGGSASSLIAAAMPDIIGCQECKDISRVLHEGGLTQVYTAVRGPHSLAIAYKTAEWELLGQGCKDVAVDEVEQFYGSRGVQWARLRHIQSSKVMLFVNHHGPLRVNSGGRQGGPETAHNILTAIYDSIQCGDALILVGDFNAQVGSQTVRGIEQYIPRVATGSVLGGIDHFFSELPVTTDLENLGRGGSDHDALAVTFAL